MAFLDRNLYISKPIYRILFRYAVEHLVKDLLLQICFADESRTKLSTLFLDNHGLMDGFDCITAPYVQTKVEEVIVAYLNNLTEEEKAASIIYVIECKYLNELYFESLDITDKDLDKEEPFEEVFRAFILSNQYDEETLNTELIEVLFENVSGCLALFEDYDLDKADVVALINRRIDSHIYFLKRIGPI